MADDISKMEAGERLIATAVERWGRIDGVVAVAGILRERMLFNMSEDEWDAVIATHLKGHFTVFRAAAAVMRKQEGGGALVGFTSGAFAGSVAQANYAAAKGGIVSLVRSAAAGLHRYGITSNAIAPVARTRMSANVPMELAEMGDPEDVAPMVVYLLSDQAKHVTGQVYTVVGSKIAVWNQPVEVRAMYAEGRWTPEQIAARLDGNVGQEKHGPDRPPGADAAGRGLGREAERLATRPRARNVRRASAVRGGRTAPGWARHDRRPSRRTFGVTARSRQASPFGQSRPPRHPSRSAHLPAPTGPDKRMAPPTTRSTPAIWTRSEPSWPSSPSQRCSSSVRSMPHRIMACRSRCRSGSRSGRAVGPAVRAAAR